MIDNFRDQPEKRWSFIADTVMGGVSTGSVSFKSENEHFYAQMIGEVSTKNNGGFIQFRHKLSIAPADDTVGVRAIVRGNGQPYFLHIRTSGTILPWQYYQASFDANADWREIRIPLTKFERSGWMLKKSVLPRSIKSIAVVAFGRDHKADIQIREIGWY